MRNRYFILVGCFAFVALGAWLGSSSLAAQTRATTSDIPSRTPDGRPDLSGVYNVATITPVERPVEYGNRLVLTQEEAAAMEQYEQQRNQKDLEPVDPNRAAPPVGGDKDADEVISRGLVPGGRRRRGRLQPDLD